MAAPAPSENGIDRALNTALPSIPHHFSGLKNAPYLTFNTVTGPCGAAGLETAGATSGGGTGPDCAWESSDGGLVRQSPSGAGTVPTPAGTLARLGAQLAGSRHLRQHQPAGRLVGLFQAADTVGAGTEDGGRDLNVVHLLVHAMA